MTDDTKTVELTKRERDLILSLLNTPVQITPVQMQNYLNLILSIQTKLNDTPVLP